jgi:hypothetical protein
MALWGGVWLRVSEDVPEAGDLDLWGLVKTGDKNLEQ